MFSSIVVGTDGSQTSARAVALAGELARRFGARLHLVNGFRDPGESGLGVGGAPAPGGVGGVGPSWWRQSSEDVLAAAAEDPNLRDVDLEVHSEVGGAAQVLIGVAERVGADLIVVGNRGMQGARQPPEAVPNVVAHAAPCHVLIAKTT
jgi:nucleotide-binding universal stress UspA family protein